MLLLARSCERFSSDLEKNWPRYFVEQFYCFFVTCLLSLIKSIFLKDFPHDFPLWKARFLPVIFGILLPIAAYHLILAMKFSEFAAVVAAFLIVFGEFHIY